MSNVTSSEMFTELYVQHHGWLFSWLRKKLGCGDNAADVAHDTFLRIISSQQMFAEVKEPRAFLTTTAKRLLIDRARRQALETAYLAELSLLGSGSTGFPSPEHILETLQVLEQIATALAAASPKAREAFLLHYLEGIGHDEIARRLVVSSRMVRKYLVQCMVLCDQVDAGDWLP